ncbi:poly(beta-D-mannuronate) lyase [Burkholderia aenigmatica]|uniref:Poly(Beta-D-mannuronate) lyase n=1 Tax=Burkholderia aenigmatica TaxID=2015348 RepID=A0A6P2SP70_9BURK|nr:poly(beta-D-mannuronate) lyase [Burkholderia aenigmatica]
MNCAGSNRPAYAFTTIIALRRPFIEWRLGGGVTAVWSVPLPSAIRGRVAACDANRARAAS